MTHDELMDSIPAYALHALEGEEEREVSLHLDFCPQCQALFAEHQETAGMLAFATDPVLPSPELKGRIMAQLEEGRAPAPARPVSRRVFQWQKVAGLATAAVVLVSAGLNVWLAARVQDQQRQAEQQRRAMAIASSPDTEILAMAAAGDGPATGRVFFSKSGGPAAVVITRLPDPGSRTYTLWSLAEGKPVRIDSLEPDESGRAVMLVEDQVGPNPVLAITAEPEPDSVTPQGPIVVKS